MVKEYDEQGYQDELDSRFYKGKRPSDERPFTLEDLCRSVFNLIIAPLDRPHQAALRYLLHKSIKRACKDCHNISSRTFYRHMKRLAKKYHFPWPLPRDSE